MNMKEGQKVSLQPDKGNLEKLMISISESDTKQKNGLEDGNRKTDYETEAYGGEGSGRDENRETVMGTRGDLAVSAVQW